MVNSTKTAVSELFFGIEFVSRFFKIFVRKDMDPEVGTSPFLVWIVTSISNVPWEEKRSRTFAFVAPEKKDYYAEQERKSDTWSINIGVAKVLTKQPGRKLIEKQEENLIKLYMSPFNGSCKSKEPSRMEARHW